MPYLLFLFLNTPMCFLAECDTKRFIPLFICLVSTKTEVHIYSYLKKALKASVFPYFQLC